MELKRLGENYRKRGYSLPVFPVCNAKVLSEAYIMCCHIHHIVHFVFHSM